MPYFLQPNGVINMAFLRGANVEVSRQLALFVSERGYALPAEWIQLEDGTHDLHPDIRFAPGDRVPSE